MAMQRTTPVAELLLHFQGEPRLGDAQGVIDLRHLFPVELDVDDRADNLHHLAA